MSYTVTKNGKTYETLLAEIDALNINQIWQGVFELMYPMHEYENLNSTYVEGEEEVYYDSLQIFQLVSGEKIYGVKLPFSDYQTVELTYKQNLKDDETDWFEETQRVFDLNARMDALFNWKQAADNVNEYVDYVNFALFKKAIIDANDSAALDLVEAEDSLLKAADDFEKDVDKKVKDIAFGQRLVAYLSKLNSDNNITPAQLTAIYSNAEVQSLISTLSTGSLNTSIALMQSIDLAGLEPITETERTFLVGKLENYLSN